MRTVPWAVVISTGLLGACSADPSPTGPATQGPRPSFAISDAAHNDGTPHFFFTEPMVRDPVPTGPFDPTAQPTIEVCEWTGTSCGTLVATFTRSTGIGGETIHVDRRAERYFANWNTSQCLSGSCVLDPAKTYRVRVLIGGLEAGFADLDVVATKAELNSVDTGEYVPLLNGKLLKIAFRIEQGLVVEPPTPGTITGTVVSATRGALSEIVILIQPGSIQAITDQNGMYTASPVPPGEVTVSVSAVPAGCTVPAPQTTTLLPGGSSQVDFTVVCTLLPAAPVRLEAGVDYSCALRNSETKCWGSNQFGKLGDGTTVARSTPTTVLGGLIFDALAVGYHHACGLNSGGTAYCWGLNGSGTLGDGTTTARPTPTAVTGGLAFKQLSANESHTCGITTSGTAYCWGGNLFGQLGVAWPVFQSVTPIAVSTDLTFHSIAAGGGHTCGLTEYGAAYCWGQNLSGQLGDGTTIQRFAPVPVQGGLTFVQLAAGDLHTCGRTPAGKAYCWGSGGQLGSGPPPVDQPAPVEVLGELSFRSLVAGAGHTCAITGGGAAYCWGGNFYGQAGQAGGDALSPIAVSGGLVFQELAGGGRHTCGLTSAGEGYCWGDNSFGELGNGTTSQTPSPTPVQVLFGS
jgi:alpha-tubulin suppressor-like RCC1 family protein